jgi:hypothetical protein
VSRPGNDHSKGFTPFYLQTLDTVIAFYVRGGRPNPELDREIVPLDLSAAERKDLVAFLRSLTGRIHDGCSEAAMLVVGPWPNRRA